MSELVTRLLGTCPVCEGTFKLHDGKMVHHGYKRPGHGSIVGDCYAVGREPYEVSCEATKEYRALVQAQLRSHQEHQARLQRRELTTMTVSRRSGGWRSELELVTFALGVTEPYTWIREYENRERAVAWLITQVEREIARLTRLVDNWTPKSVQEVMEAKLTEQRVEREKRAAERQAARDAKAAKAAAHKAKTEALEAKRAAIAADFVAQFQALAAAPESAERTAATAALAAKFGQKQYQWIYLHKMGCDEALIALGLATRESGYVRYGWQLTGRH